MGLRLYKRHTKAELTAMMEAIHNDENQKSPPGGIYLFNEKARKKLSLIAEAITMHLADDRAAAGRPVSTAGYSGRKSNR
jgi:hypothetical protein